MIKISLSTLAAALAIASATAASAAELPTYEAAGLPISAVQAGVIGAANAREQAPVATTSATPHQLSVLTPRNKMTTARAAARTDRSVH
ncbi:MULTISPECIES: hypothetical protein [Bradyrhizobium]|uniref:hypothetical protein n=1 Tax=Bradyrhizobium TaxID=374 RepID=UPI0008412718|nr:MULTISPECIES: hypothetical protein [Bradyrhizobium]MCA6098112.1 hypothetical protein [Bradyrhizobium australafricanum]MCP1973857.1 hypothetical protein [Bradyrhizobium elkanii]MCS3520920.1 hypothetical protein [Bradyrhizobium elkanii]MCS4068577.1 hypothetical protein [Bradyrhizobium elkanii]MCS4084111.1 hypothetical protein [Bradyrhizobium elkanii]